MPHDLRGFCGDGQSHHSGGRDPERQAFLCTGGHPCPYGSAIQQLGREGDWLRVSYQGKEGWVHISAVQEQKIQLSPLAGGQAQEASQDEVALAGKGFTPEVEKAFREKNPKMRYDLVNESTIL